MMKGVGQPCCEFTGMRWYTKIAMPRLMPLIDVALSADDMAKMRKAVAVELRSIGWTPNVPPGAPIEEDPEFKRLLRLRIMERRRQMAPEQRPSLVLPTPGHAGKMKPSRLEPGQLNPYETDPVISKYIADMKGDPNQLNSFKTLIYQARLFLRQLHGEDMGRYDPRVIAELRRRIEEKTSRGKSARADGSVPPMPDWALANPRGWLSAVAQELGPRWAAMAGSSARTKHGMGLSSAERFHSHFLRYVRHSLANFPAIAAVPEAQAAILNPAKGAGKMAASKILELTGVRLPPMLANPQKYGYGSEWAGQVIQALISRAPKPESPTPWPGYKVRQEAPPGATVPPKSPYSW